MSSGSDSAGCSCWQRGPGAGHCQSGALAGLVSSRLSPFLKPALFAACHCTVAASPKGSCPQGSWGSAGAAAGSYIPFSPDPGEWGDGMRVSGCLRQSALGRPLGLGTLPWVESQRLFPRRLISDKSLYVLAPWFSPL